MKLLLFLTGILIGFSFSSFLLQIKRIESDPMTESVCRQRAYIDQQDYKGTVWENMDFYSI